MALGITESQSRPAPYLAAESAKSSQLHVAVNSAGVTSIRPYHLLSARLGTPELGRRLVGLDSELRRIFGRSSVSVLPGRYVDTRRLVAYLTANGVDISSVDPPDIKSYREALRDGLVSTRHRQIADAAGHFGWARLSAGSPEQQAERTREALSHTRDPDSSGQVQVVKAHAGFWLQNPRSGQAIDDMLLEYQRAGGRVALAIEMDEQKQTPAQHLELLDKKREEYGERIGVYADIDLGHIEHARTINDGATPGALDFLDTVLQDPKLAKTVKIISLNQYRDGEQHQHARPDQGNVDFAKAAELMGRSMRQNRLDPDTVALFEPNPVDYQWFVSSEGLLYCKSINRSFIEGRGATAASASPGAGAVEVYNAS